MNQVELAGDAFRNGKYQEAIVLYQQYLQNQKESSQLIRMCSLNLSSAYFYAGAFQSCMAACLKYLEITKEQKIEPKVQSYILYCKSLIKLKKILTHDEHHFLQEAEKVFPYHKVLHQNIKTVRQLQISQNEDEYLDKMFEKLLCHPQIRNYLTEESFLTKVEKIIRNPSLAGALAKTDKRLEQVTEILLMADQDQDNPIQNRNQND